MGNTLTGLIPTIYQAFNIVAREMVGYIPAVLRNPVFAGQSAADRVAVNQTLSYPIVPSGVGGDITPGQLPPNDGDVVVGVGSMTIDKAKYFPIRWSGVEEKQISQSGIGPQVIVDQFAQAFRWLVNQIESDLASKAYKAASRAFGTAGTPPFNTANDLSDFAQSLKILDDNGAPMTDRQMVLGSGATANLRGKQAVLFKANEAGTDELLRNGIVGRVQGFDLHISGQVPSPVTKGTGSGYLVNNAGPYAIGTTAIAVDTGSGTILAGDTVTFTGDSNRYVVAADLAAGVLTIAAPGLLQTLADNVAITVGNNFTPNTAFHRNALVLLTRTPEMPEGGDSATDVMDVTDPVSGLVFQVARYNEYRRKRLEIGIVWGTKAVKSEFIAQLIG